MPQEFRCYRKSNGKPRKTCELGMAKCSENIDKRTINPGESGTGEVMAELCLCSPVGKTGRCLGLCDSRPLVLFFYFNFFNVYLFLRERKTERE